MSEAAVIWSKRTKQAYFATQVSRHQAWRAAACLTWPVSEKARPTLELISRVDSTEEVVNTLKEKKPPE